MLVNTGGWLTNNYHLNPKWHGLSTKVVSADRSSVNMCCHEFTVLQDTWSFMLTLKTPSVLQMIFIYFWFLLFSVVTTVISKSHLAVPDPFVNPGVQLVPSSHLTNVHPADKSGFLQTVPEGRHLILDIPLVAYEHLGWILVQLWQRGGGWYVSD